MSVTVPVSLFAALGLAVVHLLSGRLRFLNGTPRSIWLSIAGGISVAYVFVHLLPKLAEGQEVIAEALGQGFLALLESHMYLLSLVGLATFYGLQRAASSSRGLERRKGAGEDRASIGVFWLHISSFTAYNAIIGYLLLRREEGVSQGLLLFFLAMALHFVVNDHGLREQHKPAYHRIGRWVLSAAILLGWVLGLLADIPEFAVAAITAFLAGGIVLNVLKEELPEEREPVLGFRPRCRTVYHDTAGAVGAAGRCLSFLGGGRTRAKRRSPGRRTAKPGRGVPPEQGPRVALSSSRRRDRRPPAHVRRHAVSGGEARKTRTDRRG